MPSYRGTRTTTECESVLPDELLASQYFLFPCSVFLSFLFSKLSSLSGPAPFLHDSAALKCLSTGSVAHPRSPQAADLPLFPPTPFSPTTSTCPCDTDGRNSSRNDFYFTLDYLLTDVSPHAVLPSFRILSRFHFVEDGAPNCHRQRQEPGLPYPAV